MMLSCNRFAFVPHLCLECKRYIWLESYKSCLKKFDVMPNQEKEKSNGYVE